MLIIWGKKIKRQRLGYVADYCAVCRDLRTFQVRRIGSASHVYYLSFGDGDLVGYERECQTCSSVFDTVPDHYSGMSKQAREPTDLLSETFPNYYTVYREIIEQERKARDTPSLLTPAERAGRLREPFDVVAPTVQQKLTAVQVDKPVVIALAAFFPILWLAGGIAEQISSDEVRERMMISTLLLAIGLIGWQLLTSGQRYISRKVVPHLVKALAPLRPTEAELTAILQELKQRKLKLSRVAASELLQGIELHRTAY